MNETELTELQSLDFAFGAYLAGAFAGYADTGPMAWREFIKRPVNKQIYRHDADTPEQFMRDFLSSQKDKKAVAGEPNTTINAPLFPVVYYFRKPGIVNTLDQKGARGRVWKNNKSFDLRLRPFAIDYSLVFLAWDKLALDKITLAWYDYIYNHDAFYYPNEIGSESFDIRVALWDNKNVVIQNASDTVDGKRLYAAAATPVSVMSNMLAGKEITPPGPSRLIYGYTREDDRQYVVTPADGAYRLDSATKEGGSTAICPGTVRVLVGARIVAHDDGKGTIAGSYTPEGVSVAVAGTVDYYNGIITWTIGGTPSGPVSAVFKPLEGRIEAS